MVKPMKIGELARRTGLGTETIRYYERERLLVEPDRRPSGYRQYDESSVERLAYIQRAKALGFTLAEIRDLLELSFTASGCSHIRQRAHDKLTEIDHKIRNLRAMKRSLNKLVDRCRSNDLPSECPLVHKPSDIEGR